MIGYILTGFGFLFLLIWSYLKENEPPKWFTLLDFIVEPNNQWINTLIGLGWLISSLGVMFVGFLMESGGI